MLIQNHQSIGCAFNFLSSAICCVFKSWSIHHTVSAPRKEKVLSRFLSFRPRAAATLHRRTRDNRSCAYRDIYTAAWRMWNSCVLSQLSVNLSPLLKSLDPANGLPTSEWGPAGAGLQDTWPSAAFYQHATIPIWAPIPACCSNYSRQQNNSFEAFRKTSN